ncbi:MerR family DNA-binding transcriptional regulator [Pseudomonas amygdali]
MSGIGALSKSTGCHIETIRYYEKIGLLPPALLVDRAASNLYRKASFKTRLHPAES